MNEWMIDYFNWGFNYYHKFITHRLSWFKIHVRISINLRFFLNTQFVVHSFKIFGLGFKDMTKDGGIWVNTLM